MQEEGLTISATNFVGGVSAINPTVTSLWQIDAGIVSATEMTIRPASLMIQSPHVKKSLNKPISQTKPSF